MGVLSLLGLKVPAWVYEVVAGILIAALIAGYLEHRGALGEIAKLQKSSVKVQQDAQKEIDRNNTDHAKEVTANEAKTKAAVDAANHLGDALDNSVRQFDAYRRAHPAVASPPGGSAAAGLGECGAQSCSDLAVQLAERGDELARSNGELAAALQGAQRERDALTGLPK